MVKTDEEKAKLIKNTVDSILKQDPTLGGKYEVDTGLSVVNSREDLFYQFDINVLMTELLRKRYLKNFPDHRFIFFVSREFDVTKLFPKSEFLAFGFKKPYYKDVDITLPFSKILENQREHATVLLEHFIRSVYYGEGATYGLYYTQFAKISNKLIEKGVSDIKEIVNFVQAIDTKQSKGGSNFQYRCEKHRLNKYFSEDSELPNVLASGKHLVFSINRNFDRNDSVYPAVLSLLVYAIAEYQKENDQKTVFFLDDIRPFFAYETKGRGTERMSNMFRWMMDALNDKTYFRDYKDRDMEFHKLVANIFPSGFDELGRDDEDIADTILSLLSMNKKLIFEVNTRFFYLVQRYSNYKIDFLSGLINLGNEIRNFWEEYGSTLPFMIGTSDEYRMSNEINYNISPIDFRRYELTPLVLMRLLKSENHTVESKSEYRSCKAKVLNNILTFINHKGGNIIIGAKDGYPVEIDLKKEGFKSFDDMVDSIYQYVSQNIKPLARDLIDVQHFSVQKRDLIVISVWPSKDGTKYTDKSGSSGERFGSITFR